MKMKRGRSAGTTKFQVVPNFSDSVLKGSLNFELQQCDLLKVCAQQILTTKVVLLSGPSFSGCERAPSRLSCLPLVSGLMYLFLCPLFLKEYKIVARN